VLIAEREALGAIVAEAEEAWVRECVEGTQIGPGCEVYEGGRSGNDGGAHLKDIEIRAERAGVAIQEIRFDAGPAAGLQSFQESFNRGDGFRYWLPGREPLIYPGDKASEEEKDA